MPSEEAASVRRTGVICLTPENLSSSWLHFEAGALATVLRGRQRRPFTYLYDVEAGAIPGPLQEYQWTMSTRADTRRLVKDIIDSVDRPLPASESWESTFDREWERLDTALLRRLRFSRPGTKSRRAGVTDESGSCERIPAKPPRLCPCPSRSPRWRSAPTDNGSRQQLPSD